MTNTVNAPYTTPSYAVNSKDDKFKLWACPRRVPRSEDVRIAIEYCGICHSDLHQVRNEWQNAMYPMVPGHEIVGRVVQLGEDAQKKGKFKVGDVVGVGCFVDSCRSCDACKRGLEIQFCPQVVMTYNARGKDGEPTYGGYAREVVVAYPYVLRIPDALAKPEMLPRAAPLLCAGITTFSPLRYAGVKKGSRVAVIGLGGLGHMAVRLAKAMGCEVSLFSRSESKRKDALELLKADRYVVSSDAEAMKAEAGRYDLVVDTVSAKHDVQQLLALLAPEGKLCMLGIPPVPLEIPANALVFGRKSIFGSLVGGIKETQEMLDFCGKHGVSCEVEMITPDQIDEAYKRMDRSDVKYRFVIDVNKMPESCA
ncbi:hypothetical protein CDCA_CDCA10G3073 [Cyanidium caldarium]|uniref:Enoyl reductase (ER) domain-containing protein n=1 Tax=Cyanidium caldarium TaxID=2771 RepID=A0AAV9IZ13_CYACA|nr:hypothetical protein CDCA_CDCA10G3073 [Cyanidium caldarium]